MDAKIRETAEKIYVQQLPHIPLSSDEYKIQAKNSIEAAKAFHALCKDDMMQVKK